MANIFVTDLQIHRRFDIKGSTEGRTVGEEARRREDTDPTVIFKVWEGLSDTMFEAGRRRAAVLLAYDSAAVCDTANAGHCAHPERAQTTRYTHCTTRRIWM